MGGDAPFRDVLDDLLARVEAASGPDWELDAAVCVALGYGGPNSVGAQNVRTDPDWEDDLLFELDGVDCCARIPELTASLDAALALCERVLPEADEWFWSVALGAKHARGRFVASAYNLRTGVGYADWDAAPEPVCGHTPALALLAALLRAVQAQAAESPIKEGERE